MGGDSRSFLELNRIMLPHILDFEAEQGFDKIYECEEMDVSAHKIEIDDTLHSENLHIPGTNDHTDGRQKC